MENVNICIELECHWIIECGHLIVELVLVNLFLTDLGPAVSPALPHLVPRHPVGESLVPSPGPQGRLQACLLLLGGKGLSRSDPALYVP